MMYPPLNFTFNVTQLTYIETKWATLFYTGVHKNTCHNIVEDATTWIQHILQAKNKQICNYCSKRILANILKYISCHHCASLSCSVWFYLYLKMVERCFRNFQFWLKPQTLVGFNLDHATYLHNWKNKWHNKTRRISLLPILLSTAINTRDIFKF